MSNPELHSGTAGAVQQPDALDRVVEKIDDVSTIPQVVLRIMQVVDDPNSDAHQLKQIVEGDTSLSARLLRVVNSAAFGLRTKITNLQQAIAYLGMKQIRNLAITASVSDVFRNEQQIGSYSRPMLWRHSVSVAIGGRLLALRLRRANFEDVFLAGLLHDLGIILEDQVVHDRFRGAMLSLENAHSLTAHEQQYLGFDHTMLGERLAERWGFPDGVRAAIRYHHGSIGYQGKELDTLQCVEVANLICTLKGITSVGRKLPQFSQKAIAALNLSKTDVVVLAEDLDRELQENNALFLL